MGDTYGVLAVKLDTMTEANSKEHKVLFAKMDHFRECVDGNGKPGLKHDILDQGARLIRLEHWKREQHEDSRKLRRGVILAAAGIFANVLWGVAQHVMTQ
jgi:hypothetical protein